MPVVDAEAVIDAHMPVDRILEFAAPPGVAPLAEKTRLYVGQDGRDYISFLIDARANDPKVLGVARQLYLDPSVPLAQLQASLVQKYGQASPSVAAGTMQWSWGRSVGVGVCDRQGSLTRLEWTKAKPIKGKSLDGQVYSGTDLGADPALVQEVLKARRAAFSLWALDLQNGVYDECRPTVQTSYGALVDLGYAGERIPGAATSWLSTRLLDQRSHAASLLSFHKEQQTTPSVASPSAQLPDLKL